MQFHREQILNEVESCLQNEPGVYAVAIIDLRTGEEFLYNSCSMRSASLIKVFIMAEVFAQIKSGFLSPAKTVRLHDNDRVGGAGSLQHLPAGTSRSVMELTEIMITESDNIATNLLIELLGEAAINDRIDKLGTSHTALRRRMMDFAAAAAGHENITSVADIARMLQKIYRGHCIDESADQAMREILGRQTDRCKIPLQLPPDVICQHKTGELPGAEHDAGIIHTSSGSYILSVMSDSLPDSERACLTIARLSRIIYDSFCQ